MTPAEQIELACLMEATARKPGNVHPAAAFNDLDYNDFVQAASAIARPLATAPDVGLGRAIFDAVQATRTATGTNVNLGIVLLLAPLTAVPESLSLEQGLHQVLNQTTVADAEQVYAAIRLAVPGGLGEAASQDISQAPTVTLQQAMALAADRDRIAEQYINGFDLVFQARRQLEKLFADQLDWEEAMIRLFLWMLSQWPDTLIARKCGPAVAQEASSRAAAVINRTDTNGKSPGSTSGTINEQLLFEFDTWLRADGHRRNPGTTADLVAATLFAALRDGLITAPSFDDVRQRAAAIR